MSDEQQMKPIEKKHVVARRALRERYNWEIEVITQDIINKLEMEVLNNGSITAYVSNLLQSHPRIKEQELALETLMVSPGRGMLDDDSELLAPTNSEIPYIEDAYHAMAYDIFFALEYRGIDYRE